MNTSIPMAMFCRQLLHYQRSPVFFLSGVRSLYSITSLGVDGYLQQRERIKTQFDTLGDRFRSKMKDFVAPSSSNMVFTEDLKQMIHLADGTEEDLDLIEQMMVKFNKQNKDLRFGSYIFGPVVMRMYHHLNKPKEALKVFFNDDMGQFFDQVASFQILMDLLLRNEMYDEVMQVADIVKEKQLSSSRFPRTVVVLAMAAAYKKNTAESMQYMKELWATLQETGHEPMRKAVTFAAALAINQHSPHIALEILSQVPKQNYVSVRNLKVSALADVNRPDDALPLLRGVLEFEGPQERKHTFCEEVVEKVRAAVDKSDMKEVKQEFQRIVDQLTHLGHISSDSLESVLCSEIERVTFPYRKDQQHVLSAKFNPTDNRSRFGYQRNRRPGLLELE